MGNARVTNQVTHIAGSEHITHHTAAFVHVKRLPTGSHNPCCILTTVLQHLQTVIKQLINRLMRHQTENTTHGKIPYSLEGE